MPSSLLNHLSLKKRATARGWWSRGTTGRVHCANYSFNYTIVVSETSLFTRPDPTNKRNCTFLFSFDSIVFELFVGIVPKNLFDIFLSTLLNSHAYFCYDTSFVPEGKHIRYGRKVNWYERIFIVTRTIEILRWRATKGLYSSDIFQINGKVSVLVTTRSRKNNRCMAGNCFHFVLQINHRSFYPLFAHY